MKYTFYRYLFLCAALALSAACSAPIENVSRSPVPNIYGPMIDGDIRLPEVDLQYLREPNRRSEVIYSGYEPAGTIVVDPYAKFLYFIEAPGRATRYPIAVGRDGRGFRGRATIQHRAEWPGWTPTKNMLRTEPEIYGPFARGIPGGIASPLGARALYLYRGGRDTRYRIHGTSNFKSIGNASSAGCIRMFNQDVIHLFDRAPNGTKVIVRSYEESVAAEGYEMANRGVDLPPEIVNPEDIYAAVEAEKQRRATLSE